MQFLKIFDDGKATTGHAIVTAMAVENQEQMLCIFYG
jgi:hypothetical protein